MMKRGTFWNGRKYHLDKMSLRDLIHAYFAYPAIQAYLGLGTISAIAALWWQRSIVSLGIAAIAAVLIYPLIWYLLHRFILHGRFLYKMRWSAGRSAGMSVYPCCAWSGATAGG